MMQPPMDPTGGGGLPPELLQALMAQNPQMGMDPGMDPSGGMPPMSPEDEAMMMAEGGGMPAEDPMAAMTGLDPQMANFPSTDPSQIAAVLAEMRAQDEMQLAADQQMQKIKFMEDANQAAMLAVEMIRSMQANSAATATSPHEGFSSGIGMPPDDMIA